MQELEMKKCPLCGGRARLRLAWYPDEERCGTFWNCRCNTCDAQSPMRGTKARAVEAWNDLTEKDALEAKLAYRVAEGIITEEEAEDEWQEFMHRSEVWSEF